MSEEKNERRVPKLRFKGFTDDWMQEKVINISKEQIGGGTPSTKNENYWNGNIPWIQSSDIKDQKLFNVKPEKYISLDAVKNSAAKVIKENSISIVTRVGVGKVAYIPFSFSTSQDFLSLQNLIIDPIFGTYSIFQLMKKLSYQTQGTSIKGITHDHLLNSYVDIPVNQKESKLVGRLLKSIDKIIALEQEKINIWSSLKLYLSNKLYAYKCNYPLLRFQSFTKSWQSQKIQDIADTFSGGTPTVTNSDYYGGKIPFIRCAEINNTRTELFLTQEGVINSSAKRVCKGDILYALYGATSGEVGVSKIDGVINQAILAIKPNESIDTYFLSSLLELNKSRIINRYLQGGQGNLSARIINNLVFLFPSQKEQKLIGEILIKSEEVIQLEQKKLKKHKKIKEMLLNLVFI